MNRAQRRERSTVVMHATTAVALIAKGLGNIGDPSASRLLVALPLIGGALAVASVVRHRRGHEPSRLAEAASTVVEGATCAVVGAASAARGTQYIQFAWFFAALILIGSAVLKARQVK